MKKGFVIKTIATALIYSALLLPFQINLPVFAGTEIRPSAFVPVVMGIFWGWPAAAGIFIGNLFCDFLCFKTPFIIIGSVLNGFSAVLARAVFYVPVKRHPMVRGQYIYSLDSLLKFIFTVLVVELVLTVPISILVHLYSGESVMAAFSVTSFNNVLSNVFFGIPVMLYLPLAGKWADLPRRGNIIDGDPALYGFRSLRYTTFRRMMIFVLISSAALSAVIVFVTANPGADYILLITKTFHICATADIVYLIFFALSYHNLEKNIISPIHDVASKISLSGENYANELDIIKNKLDFVVSEGAEHISGDEFSIFIGLTTKDNSKRFSVSEANRIINNICLQHVSGYISSVDGIGGYRGGEYAGMEQMLIYTIFGATDSQIKAISNDILQELDQESVIIEKNRLVRYYYYGM
ncbi:MAG: hypothetical protein Q4G10_06550 [Bacteroidia bacterium]|nr:hypothetical protein [Bacteroidia bacterium]